MKYELPPQRKWPHDVHPPGNASAIVTPTMEKLAAQGNHAAEQKEVGSEGRCENERELNLSPSRPSHLSIWKNS